MREYDPYTQQLTDIVSSHASEGVIQDLGYQWDAVGNLTQRRDDRSGRVEDFAYDSLNRLDYSELNGFTNLDVEYDAAGNIDTRSGTGVYAYNTDPNDNPHAVQSIALDAGGTMNFSYDANGSLLQVGNKTIAWTSYRYPEQITNSDNNTVTSFGYGPDRQRYRETIVTNGTDIRRVDVLGTLYKRIEAHGTITHKHYIQIMGKAGSKVVAVHDRRMNNDGSNATGRLVYLHRDHLGSVDTVTTAAGSAMTRMSYSAYGERRDPTDWDSDIGDAELAANRDITTRGYTGHQMLDDSGFIHMGGRVYDPFTGRFLSADPNIPDPSDSRSFDRYAYVYNNPLSYTDPSGFVPSMGMMHGSAYHPSPIGLGMAAMFGSVGESVTGNGSFGIGYMSSNHQVRAQKIATQNLIAAIKKKLSEVSASAVKYAGEPDPSTVKPDDLTVNTDLLDNVSVTFTKNDNGLVTGVAIAVNGTIAQNSGNPADFDIVVGSINSLNGASASYNGVDFSLSVNVEKISSVENADWAVNTGPTLGSEAAPGKSGHENPMNIETKSTRSIGQLRFTGAHEFFHTLGLWHRPNSTRAITSYAYTSKGIDHRRVTGQELFMITRGYMPR